jgi:hypothetical protein
VVINFILNYSKSSNVNIYLEREAQIEFH